MFCHRSTRLATTTMLLLSLLLLLLCVTLGFQTQPPIAARRSTTTTTTNSALVLYGGPIKIDEWEILRSGAVRGTVSNHPDLPDGYEITTSPLETPSTKIKDNALVTTLSGSKYKLLKGIAPTTKTNNNTAKANAKTDTTTTNNNNNNNNRSTISIFGQAAASKPKAKPKSKPAMKAKAPVAKKTKPTTTKPTTQTTTTTTTKDYNLNGKIVGSATNPSCSYLLVGNLIKSSSKRSQIYYAYEGDSTTSGKVKSNTLLTVKLQNSQERLERESKNYDRVFSKGRVAFSLEGSASCFVRKVAFVPFVEGKGGIPKGSSALVLESGDENLRTYVSKKGGLQGSALRKAAVNVCRCVEAMHSAGLVWTDLKAENFVLVNKDEVKGIDLESAVPIRSPPEDYSPEACPPEFAAAEKANRGYDFECLKNYDSWSLGMLFFELATGRNYFRGKSESQMTTELASQALIDETTGTATGLEAIEDDNFRDLVAQCLNANPNKRPSIGQIFLHPYFLTTGFGPLTF